MKQIVCGTLRNGLRVYSKYDKTSYVSGVGVRVGSIYDPPGCRGMAHLAEHVVARRSTSHDSRTADLLFRKYLGGPDDDINIRMDRISTFFGHEDLLQQDHMSRVFDIMASMVRDRIVDQEGLEVEKAAVHQEYCLRGRDALEDEITTLVHENLYTTNPARNRIDCEVTDLQTITRDKLAQFVRRYYVPRNMFVVMIGPSHAKVMDLARRYFEDNDEKTTPRLDYDHSDDVPVLSKPGEIIIGRPGIHQHHVAIAWPTCVAGHPDSEALDILADLLSLRLAWRLREQNRQFDAGAYRTPVYTERSFCHGLLYAHVATTSGEFAQLTREVILAEAAKLRSALVPADEFEAIRTHHDYRYRMAFRYGASILTEMIIEATCNGDTEMVHLNTFRERLAKVNRQRIRQVANQYLTDSHLAVMIRPV